MSALGLGMVDLALAGHAIIAFKAANVLLIGLVIPGVIGWVVFDLDGRKKTAKETALEDEGVLSPSQEEQPFSVGETVRAGIGSVVFLAVDSLCILLGIGVATMWFYIVWDSVNDGHAYGLWDVLDLLRNTVLSNARYAFVMTGLIAAIMVASIAGPLLLRPFKRWWKKRANDPASQPDPLVETRLRAVWDYANQPDHRALTFPVLVLPFLLFGAAFAGFMALAIYDDEVALYFARGRHLLPESWYVFKVSTGYILFVLGGGMMAAWSLWHFLVDRWPGAAEAVMTMSYRRNGQNVTTSVASLRRCLRRLVTKAGDAPFDPRQFLLTSRHRSGRWLYGIAVVCVAVSVWGTWASFNSYTLLTPNGIEDVNGFRFTRGVWLWQEVRRIEVGCTLDHEGDSRFDWEAQMGNGRRFDLFWSSDIAHHLPELLRVDSILRGQGTVFQTRNPVTRESTVTAACLDKVGADVTDRQGFLRLMHQD